MSTQPSSGKADRRAKYSPDFKRDAVALAAKIGVNKAAQDLGINRSMLSTWKAEIRDRGNQAFEPIEETESTEAELKRLREEVRVLRMERDILKKAATFFAKENG